MDGSGNGSRRPAAAAPASVARVRAWTETVILPTYRPARPDRNPMFLEKRVYQGSSGRVYPLPFTDRIDEARVPRRWKAVWIENEYLRVMVLPELGGRIHRLIDKTTGCDLIYYQPVIKPALVGLAGPWVSGGIELNWPQHHRPATFLPVDVEMEEHDDGSKTAWFGDHDPMLRMKGMHGVCLHPGRAVLQLKVRIYNRTPFTQTFLWWANAAIRVHELYQSFFPPDVCHVADHARRATSEYPLAKGIYYGVNYGRRARHGTPPNEVPLHYVPPHCRQAASATAASGPAASGPAYAPNDLSWYANIPTPCSYMAMGSREDFLGGYDHRTHTGIVHVANHRIAPGKKQWTWGNHPFGYAWDRNLTDATADGEFPPYIELMSGVYTDNQPDFSFLAPGETRSWSQYWYPIWKIGPVQHANAEAAASLQLGAKRVRIGVSVTREHRRATIRLERANGAAEWTADVAPGRPFVVEVRQARVPWREGEATLRVRDRDGREIMAYSPRTRVAEGVPAPAREPHAPEKMSCADELYITGLHLEQYRHATRCPSLYWREALRRDPLDSRCNTAMGRWHLHRGEFASAERHFRQAIARLTSRNSNPFDGEPFYHLGLCLRHLGRDGEAYDAFYKATWNLAWAGPAFHALAEIDCCRRDWDRAQEHLERSIGNQSGNARAMNLEAMVAASQGRSIDARAIAAENRRMDPLDWWARHLLGETLSCDLQTCLDLAHDHARAGFHAEAVRILSGARRKPRDIPDQSWGAAPMVQYTLGWLEEKLGHARAALKHYRAASALPPDYCFPSRLEDITVLASAMRANPEDARAPYYLGNLLYDRRRHDAAIRLWERSAELDPGFPIVWRNLGLGYFNIRRRPAKARAAYEKAFRADPGDARLLFERDQLWKRLGVTPARRRRELEKHPALVRRRDDLTVELCALHNLTGHPAKARQLLDSRRFQPWEGGEGAALGQHVRTQLALGREAFARGDFSGARGHLEKALRPPENLGEAAHLHANQGEIHYWLGCAFDALGERSRARAHWIAAARSRGDFQGMKVRTFAETSHSSALAMERLGRRGQAKRLWLALLRHARQLAAAPARIDYFATSLPTMLLFEDDLQARQRTSATFLEAQARLGLGQGAKARALLKAVLRRDPSHGPATELLRELESGK